MSTVATGPRAQSADGCHITRQVGRLAQHFCACTFYRHMHDNPRADCATVRIDAAQL